jgi:hypothetical protein
MMERKKRKLTDREVATILHALRIFQHDGPGAEAGSCDHFEECQPLTNSEVDALCKSINFDNLHIEEDVEEYQEDDYEPTNYFRRDGKVRDRK